MDSGSRSILQPTIRLNCTAAYVPSTGLMNDEVNKNSGCDLLLAASIFTWSASIRFVSCRILLSSSVTWRYCLGKFAGFTLDRLIADRVLSRLYTGSYRQISKITCALREQRVSFSLPIHSDYDGRPLHRLDSRCSALSTIQNEKPALPVRQMHTVKLPRVSAQEEASPAAAIPSLLL